MMRISPALLAVVMLTACGTPGSDRSSAAGDVASEVHTLDPGRHCFTFTDGVFTIRLDIDVAVDGTVTGSRETDLSDADNDMWDNALSDFTGTVADGVLRVHLNEYRDDAVTEEDAVWAIVPGGVKVGSYEATACEALASLCSASERAYFSCPLDGTGNMVALCGSVGLTSTSGVLQYRFGTQDNVLEVHPASPAGSLEAFQWDSAMYSGGWDTRVQFESGGKQYQLYDRAIKETMSAKDFSAGILTIEGGRETEDRACVPETFTASDVPIRLNHLAGVLTQESFIDQ